jgi:hypothetical protein
MDSRVRGSDKLAHGHSRARGNPLSGVLESLPELFKQLLRVLKILQHYSSGLNPNLTGFDEN